MWINGQNLIIGSKLLISYNGNDLSVEVKSMTENGVWLESYGESKESLKDLYVDKFFKSTELIIVNMENIDKGE